MENEKINMTKEEYTKYVENKSEKSPIIKNIIWAFVVGGLICVLGEAVADIAKKYGIEEKTAITIATISLIFLGAFLTSIKVFQEIGKFAGAGTAIPITGFSNSIVAPAIEYKSEGYILGIGSNMFKVAGPVLVFGIISSCVIGFMHWVSLMV